MLLISLLQQVSWGNLTKPEELRKAELGSQLQLLSRAAATIDHFEHGQCDLPNW